MMVVVGINLLREGIDLPEVSLVAILDADKERLPALGVGTLSRPSGARTPHRRQGHHVRR